MTHRKNRDLEAKNARLTDALAAAEKERAWFAEVKEANDTLAEMVHRLTRERDEARASDLQTGEVLAQTHAAHVKASAEVTRLTEALAAANRGCAENGEAADCYRDRAEAAEARVRELIDALEPALLGKATAEARVRELEADISKFVVRTTTADRQLAAANALLKRAVDEINSDIHDDPVTIQTVADIHAHLASQPAKAPTDPPAALGIPPKPNAIERGKLVERMFEDEPAPARTEAECCIGGKRTERWCGTQRSEAEQAVLDALGEFRESWMREAISDATETRRGLNPRVAAFVKVFQAELARRGLKP